MTTFATHAAEGGHWYDERGRQVVAVTGSKGKDVKPDIRHARRLDLCPGVTTIIGCSYRGGLEVWKQRQVMMAALTATRLDHETDADLCSRIMRDAKAEAEAAAESGSAIHAQIERHVRMPALDSPPIVHAAMQAIEAVAGCEHAWDPERACVSPLGYGTKADLSCPSWVWDFKSKDGDLSDVRIYDEHAMQVAATREALGYRHARGGICFVSRTHETKAVALEIPQEELRTGMECFRGLLRYWQAKNRYRPGWATEDP